MQDVIATLPSAGGQKVLCETPELVAKHGLVTCKWSGLAPNVGGSTANKEHELESRHSDSITLSVARSAATEGRERATWSLGGNNTRACRLYFDQAISDFNITGAAIAPQSKKVAPETGAKQLRLWHREWDRPWNVSVEWPLPRQNPLEATEKNTTTTHKWTGRAACLWSDVNEPGVIPAFDEVKSYMPIWAIVTKLDDGLVMGWKSWEVQGR